MAGKLPSTLTNKQAKAIAKKFTKEDVDRILNSPDGRMEGEKPNKYFFRQQLKRAMQKLKDNGYEFTPRRETSMKEPEDQEKRTEDFFYGE